MSPVSAVPDNLLASVGEKSHLRARLEMSYPLRLLVAAPVFFFLTEAELNSGNRVIITDDTVSGTSKPVSGDFRLDFNINLTGTVASMSISEAIEGALPPI